MSFHPEEYYKRFIELQEKLRKSEEERLKLEIKFNEMVHVTSDEKRHHVHKLRSQYKKFLDEDRRRQDRNDHIKRSLDRVEGRIAVLVAKTERFKLLRLQYQAFLKRISASDLKKEELAMRPPKEKGDGDVTDDIIQRYLRGVSSNRLRELLLQKEQQDLDDYSVDDEVQPNYANSVADDIVHSLHDFRESIKRRETSYVGRKQPYLQDSVSGGSSSESERDSRKYLKPEEALKKLVSKDNVVNRTFDGSLDLEKDINQNVPTNFEIHEAKDVSVIENKKLHEDLESVNGSIDEKKNVKIPDVVEEKENVDEGIKTTIEENDKFEESNSVLFENNEKVEQDVDFIEYEKKDEYDANNQQESNEKDEQSVEEYDENVQSHRQDDENSQFLQQYHENEEPIQENNENDPSIQQQEENEQSGELYHEIDQPSQQNDEKDQLTPQYNEKEQLIEQYDKNGQPMLQYDENGEMIQQYDESGQLMQQYDENGQSYQQQYDENGQPIQQYDENGQPIQQYDENEQFIQQYDENGQPIQQYDENGQFIQQYDENGQPIQQYDENGQFIQPYDENGQPIQQYDENGQLIQQYDENGQPIQQYDENGQLIQQYDETGQLYQQQYDENGQLIQQYDENGQPILYDENGQPYQQQYDENGQPIEQYDQSVEQHNPPHIQEATDQIQSDDQYPNQSEGDQQIKEPKNTEDLKQEPDVVASVAQNQDNIFDDAKKPAPTVMDMLDTDTESSKHETKVSHDSDFDFSNT